ncbi:NAD(P)H-quinone oxidoreductase subunit U [Cardamine amara subsp. amara]|uniref:NAD(P)H-quinone oxidoreductase subunit U n=1 Tax=Cardamine amara subsp. amara TaxID=228776 RepID=A0ABD1ABR8_CARAN
MASLSTTITQPSLVHIPGESVLHHVPSTCSFPWKSVTTTKRIICSPARNSGEVSAEAETNNGGSSTAVDEAPKENPSLISALNVERALRGLPITDVDHYGRLGLSRNCSYDQVRIGYQDKVKELKEQGLDEEQLKNKLDLVKESYTILSTVEERRMYDWSLARSENAERYVWPFQVDIMEPSSDEPPPQEPEDVGPTRLLGYFIGAWLVLGVALSVAFNR